MSFYTLLEETTLGSDAFSASLTAFAPELVLCATIVLLLLARMFGGRPGFGAYPLMIVGCGTALFLTVQTAPADGPVEIFTGMLVFDTFSVYTRQVLLLFALLFTTFVATSGVPAKEDTTEFYVLVLGALLGMCLMVSANHMLIVFLGIEMASVPSYALVGIVKHQRRATEAALKYCVFGAGAAGVMLYGISLLVGTLGSAHVPTMAGQIARMNQRQELVAEISLPRLVKEVQVADVAGRLRADLLVSAKPQTAELIAMLEGGSLPEEMPVEEMRATLDRWAGTDRSVILALAGLMVMVGLGFKLSVVPFHFWTPDVFDGAPAEVGAFLSIASKAAALALLVRLTLGFGYTADTFEHPALAAVESTAGQSIGSEEGATLVAAPGPSGLMEHGAAVRSLAPVRRFMVVMLSLLAAATCTFGNLAAYGQTNIKRMLAYSTIAHAGYMIMPVAAALALLGDNPEAARAAIAALAFYVFVYVFMNLGAFAGVAFLRNATGSEEIADYAGLVRRSPGLAICLSLIFFSLIGLPPLAGFSAKFTVFASLLDAGLIGLLCIGGMNTALSLFYYLRVVKVMVLDEEAEETPAPTIPLSSNPALYCLLVATPLVVFGIWWDPLFQWAETATSMLLY